MNAPMGALCKVIQHTLFLFVVLNHSRPGTKIRSVQDSRLSIVKSKQMSHQVCPQKTLPGMLIIHIHSSANLRCQNYI